MIGMTGRERIKNEVMCKRWGTETDIACRVDGCFLKWFGRIEMKDTNCLAKRAMNANVNGRTLRGWLKFCWIDGIMNTFS